METTCVDIFHVIPGGEVIVDGCGKSWQKISDTGYQRVEDALAYARKYYT